MADLAGNISKNITNLRKNRNWTQQDLAEKLNYSDKTVSKWERGESTPDIEMLARVAEVFEVDINFLIREHSQEEINRTKFDAQLFIRNLLILIMACVAVFFISTIVFIYPVFRNPDNAKRFWVSYIYAIPVCSLLCYYYAKRMGFWLMRMITISVFVWSLITASYLLMVILGYTNFWLLFLVGIPIQASICLFFFWKKTF